MFRKDIIESSASPWALPVVLVKKKVNTLRFCVDCRKLNIVTKRVVYLLPRIWWHPWQIKGRKSIFFFGPQKQLLADRGGQMRPWENSVCHPRWAVWVQGTPVWLLFCTWHVSADDVHCAIQVEMAILSCLSWRCRNLFDHLRSAGGTTMCSPQSYKFSKTNNKATKVPLRFPRTPFSGPRC